MGSGNPDISVRVAHLGRDKRSHCHPEKTFGPGPTVTPAGHLDLVDFLPHHLMGYRAMVLRDKHRDTPALPLPDTEPKPLMIKRDLVTRGPLIRGVTVDHQTARTGV